MNTSFSRISKTRLVSLALLTAILAPSLVNAQDANTPPLFSSGPAQVSLLELYTSEGCSSCPPADRWLSQLADGEALWQSVVPVAFHVSYWDRLGWPDRFAQRKFDTRQRLLAARADAGVYTPGMFRNGSEFRTWRRTPPEAIEQATEQTDGNAGNLQLRLVNGNSWQLTYTPAVGKAQRADQAFVAVLGNNLQNNVPRGENAGKLLEHDFVVLSLASSVLQPLDTPDSTQTNPTVQATFAVDTAVTAEPALAAWVVDATGNPLQAVGGEL